MDFGRWNNSNNSAISEIIKIIALLLHLLSIIPYYTYSGVGHDALLALLDYYCSLYALLCYYFVAIIGYHYTLLLAAWFWANNTNNAVIKVKLTRFNPTKRYHYTLLYPIIHYYLLLLQLLLLFNIHYYCNISIIPLQKEDYYCTISLLLHYYLVLLLLLHYYQSLNHVYNYNNVHNTHKDK